jgi:mono/diheme cytochrome c family protein
MQQLHRLLVVSAILAILAFVAVVSFLGEPQRVSAQAAQGDAARGEYLVVTGACADCHTTEKGAYAGGLEFDMGPLGVYYSSNLTILQDWTTDDFKKALRQGIEPKTGRILAPAMPYPAYRGMSDDDVAAIGAYLKSLKPIENKVTDAKPGPAAGEALKALPDVSIPMPKIEDTAEYGKYIVESLTACGDCHTPRDAAGAFLVGKDLTGGGINLGTEEEPIFAPPINGPVLNAAGYTKETFIAAMRSGVRPWGARISPHMPYRFYSKLTDNDLTAIWNFLQTKKLDVPWPVGGAAAPATQPATAATAAATQAP